MPPGPVKISHNKDGRQRQLYRFLVSRPSPLPSRWIRYCCFGGVVCLGGGGLVLAFWENYLWNEEQCVILHMKRESCCLRDEDLSVNKNAFQWDEYRPLVDRIPACTMAGGCTCLGGGGTFPGGFPPGGCTSSGGTCPGLPPPS